jgi:hypothetical protein
MKIADFVGMGTTDENDWGKPFPNIFIGSANAKGYPSYS